MKKLILVCVMALIAMALGCAADDANTVRDKVISEAGASGAYLKHYANADAAEFEQDSERWKDEKANRDQRVQEITAAEVSRRESIAALHKAYVEAVKDRDKDLMAEIRRGIEMLQGTAESYTLVRLINNTDKMVVFRINDVSYEVNPHTEDTPQISPGRAYVSIEDDSGKTLWTAEREIPDAGKNQVAYWFSWP